MHRLYRADRLRIARGEGVGVSGLRRSEAAFDGLAEDSQPARHLPGPTETSQTVQRCGRPGEIPDLLTQRRGLA